MESVPRLAIGHTVHHSRLPEPEGIGLLRGQRARLVPALLAAHMAHDAGDRRVCFCALSAMQEGDVGNGR